MMWTPDAMGPCPPTADPNRSLYWAERGCDAALTEAESAHLDGCPPCRDLYLSLSALQQGLTASATGSEAPDGPDHDAAGEAIWSALSLQLAEDRLQAVPCGDVSPYDDEWLGALLDGELSEDEPLTPTFWAHLNACPSCIDRWADLQTLQSAVRQTACQLEGQIDDDRLADPKTWLPGAWPPDANPMPQPCSAQTDETLWAFLDAALAPREAMDLAAHLEGCAACRTALNGYRELSDAVHGAVERLAATQDAPDFWPRIAFTVRQAEREYQRLTRKKTLSWPRWGTVAAAVALLATFFSLPLGNDPRPDLTLTASAPTLERAVPRSGAALVARSVPSAEEYLFMVSDRELPPQSEPLAYGESAQSSPEDIHAL